MTTPLPNRITIAQLPADALVDHALKLAVLATERDDGELAGLAAQAVDILRDLIAVGELLATVAGVPEPERAVA